MTLGVGGTTAAAAVLLLLLLLLLRTVQGATTAPIATTMTKQQGTFDVPDSRPEHERARKEIVSIPNDSMRHKGDKDGSINLKCFCFFLKVSNDVEVSNS